VLDDFAAVIEPKYVDSRIVLIAWPLLVAVQHHVFTVSEYALEVNPFAGILSSHALKILDEWLFAVGYLGIVLNVLNTDELLNCFAWLALIEHQVIECLSVRFVLLSIAHIRTCSAVSRKSKLSDVFGPVRNGSDICRVFDDRLKGGFRRFCHISQRNHRIKMSAFASKAVIQVNPTLALALRLSASGGGRVGPAIGKIIPKPKRSTQRHPGAPRRPIDDIVVKTRPAPL
jgi:hypothetical protein